MNRLDQALFRFRDVALNRLAQQERLVRTPTWRRIALHRQSLTAALMMLRRVQRAGHIGRWWIWLSASFGRGIRRPD